MHHNADCAVHGRGEKVVKHVHDSTKSNNLANPKYCLYLFRNIKHACNMTPKFYFHTYPKKQTSA